MGRQGGKEGREGAHITEDQTGACEKARQRLAILSHESFGISASQQILPIYVSCYLLKSHRVEVEKYQ